MLEISRSNIDSKELTEYPQSTRFIKLNIEAYLKLLSVYDPVAGQKSTAWDEINGAQIALINAVNSPDYRFICAALARRLGKTFIANIIGQLTSLIPGYNVLIMSPNFSLSSISFELQRSFIKNFDLEVERDNLKDKVIELSNGSTIRMGSVSTVDSSVGRSYNLIIFDEAALSADGENAFNVSLRPTLDRPGSKAIFISTPRGKNNWFSKFFERGQSQLYPEWVSIRADYTENHRMKESDVAEARRTMSRAQFEQEYMANFSVYEGQIYEVTEDQIEHDYIRQDEDEIFAGIDPGYKDPTAFIVLAYRPSVDTFYIIEEYCEAERTTVEHCKFFAEIIGRHGVETIFIDSAAAQFASDLAYVYDIATIKAKKDVLPGIAYVQSLVQSGRLRICSSCVKTLEAMDQYQWDAKEGLAREKPIHTWSHIPDAVRYALYTYTT